MKAVKKMTPHWGAWVGIESRYQRSVHLERDLDASSGLAGYIITPLVKNIIGRISPALEPRATTRAWSITGPYGSGKSALALFLSRALSVPSAPGSTQARLLLKQQSPDCHKQLFGGASVLDSNDGLVPVLVTGERAPLEALLLRALRDAVRNYWNGPGTKPDVIRKAEGLHRRAVAGERISTRDITDLFSAAAAKVAASNKPGRGLLIVLDEAGKALEFAARNPEQSDVHVLQELAELANRSAEAPILFAVVLHQAFENYAGRLSAGSRNEWAKVQGRFQDVPFQEASDQVLRLVGAALSRRALPPDFDNKSARRSIQAVAAIVCEGSGWNHKQVSELLLGTLPLHPVTALALAPLFRGRLAQNERSLFAFLASSEPGGFRAFLNEDVRAKEWPLFALDRFYDYVESAFGNRLQGTAGRSWVQIEHALTRLPTEATGLDARLVKAIGLLGSLGDRSGISASPKILELAFEGVEGASKREIAAALARLSKASVLVYRRYRDAFQLWDGSDLDLDQLVEEALVAVDGSADQVNRLGRLAPSRPVVARRHLFQTGTLRYFDVLYADETLLERGLDIETSADGVIWLLIPTSQRAQQFLNATLAKPMTWLSTWRPALAAVLRDAGRIRSLARDITAMEWVRANTAELQDDPVARRELEGRIANAQHALQQEIDGIRSGATACDWFSSEGPITVPTPRSLTSAVSDVCDRVYPKTPRLHNELLNRRELSSAAARARRELMTAMVEKTGLERLGFEGAPPELSMYRSLLERSALHAPGENGEWFLRPPSGTQDPELRAAWDLVQGTFRSSDSARIRVADLYAKLRQPPFGMKEGPIPVLLLAVLLCGADELAVYEDGIFVPKLAAAEIERLLRSPDRFEVQRFAVAGPRRAVMMRLTAAFVAGAEPGAAATLPVVRVLVRLVNQLPEYSRNTHAMSERAQAVREALLRAREPGTLLFDALPHAVGCDPITIKARSDTEVDDFLSRLRGALGELQSAYDRLLDSQVEQLQSVFDLPIDRASMRQELAARATRVVDLAADPKLKGFLIRAAAPGLEEREWLTSISTLLGGKPPAAWRDDDRALAEMTLARLRQQFAAIEAMSIAAKDGRARHVELLRVSITQAGGQETERVVSLQTKRSKAEGIFRKQLEDLLATSNVARDVMLGELGLAAQRLISEHEDRPSQPPVESRGQR